MRFRVASAGAGGTIELRLDSPTGTLAGHDGDDHADRRLADVQGRLARR